MSDRRARAASPRRRPWPASRACTTPAPRPAACGRAPTAATTWKPTFDKQTSQAIGALAVAPTNPNIVWAGTGEAWAVRDMDMMGDGIYKSTDAGETWTNMGLVETGRIGTIVVHPTNENIVLVCALGRATGPQRERGVYRTEDGGKTWQQVLFVNENTGCSGLQISQQDPNVVIAGTWEIELQTHVLESGGMGSGIYLSHDGGKHVREDHAPGTAEVAVRQDRRRDRAVGRQPHVRADSDRRGRRQGPEVRSAGLAVAIGRRRHARGAK